LKQKLKSAVQKMWNSATGKTPEKSKSNSQHTGNDMLPPHS
jgi:hypothetical protein